MIIIKGSIRIPLIQVDRSVGAEEGSVGASVLESCQPLSSITTLGDVEINKIDSAGDGEMGD